MNKEQFFTFKSDFKKGMRIARLSKKHVKAYWNDGYASQEEQNEAIKKDNEEIKSLEDSIVLKEPYKRYTINGYVDDMRAFVLGDYATHHWAYYCAKHRLDRDSSIEYLKDVMLKSIHMDFYHTPEEIYDKVIKVILDKYEKIVCTD